MGLKIFTSHILSPGCSLSMPVLNDTSSFLEFYLTNTKCCQLLIWAHHQPTSVAAVAEPCVALLSAAPERIVAWLHVAASPKGRSTVLPPLLALSDVSGKWQHANPSLNCWLPPFLTPSFFFLSLFLNPRIRSRAHQGFYEQWRGLMASVQATALLIHSRVVAWRCFSGPEARP